MFSKEYFEKGIVKDNDPDGTYRYDGMYKGLYAFGYHWFTDVINNVVRIVGYPQYILCNPHDGDHVRAVSDVELNISLTLNKQKAEAEQSIYDEHLSKGLEYWKKMKEIQEATYPHHGTPCLYN